MISNPSYHSEEHRSIKLIKRVSRKSKKESCSSPIFSQVHPQSMKPGNGISSCLSSILPRYLSIPQTQTGLLSPCAWFFKLCSETPALTLKYQTMAFRARRGQEKKIKYEETAMELDTNMRVTTTIKGTVGIVHEQMD